jgi:hypothetical protein
MKKPKLPQTDSVRELADFWDTHDLTDFEVELEEVPEPAFVRAGDGKGYHTNLAAEYYVLSVLHRLGMSATLTRGNKKSVDIVVTRDVGDALTIDVKGLAGRTNWPVDKLKEGRKNHFIAFVTFLGRIHDPAVLPEVYLVPSAEVSKLVYRNPAGNRRVIPYTRARQSWAKFRDAWELLR